MQSAYVVSTSQFKYWWALQENPLDGAPMTDKGRWRIPEYVVKDKDLLEYARQQGITAKKELEETLINPQSHSPQKIWYEFKMKLVQKARERARQIIPGYIRKINEKQLELDRGLMMC